jgi:integrase
MSRHLLRDNPIAGYKLSKPPFEPKGGPSLKQVESILAASPKTIRPALAILAFTGMRSGELQRLKPGDVDTVGGWIFIRSRDGAETKTRLSRKVPIHDRARPHLQALGTRSRTWYVSVHALERRDVPEQLDTNKLNEAFRSVLRSLSIPEGRKNGGFTLHSLRHFFETETVNQRIPQRVIDNWLGHNADRSMGAQYYRLSDDESQSMMRSVRFETQTEMKPAAGIEAS